jgi:ubiquinone/menaquinone biosynthesis C-methylase UbiE
MFLLNYGTLIDPLFRDIRKFTPEFAGMRAGDKVIDICCGTGAQVLEYGRRGIVATGIDLDPNMLKAALKNKRKENAVNVSFNLADAAALPFPDNSFDYASISLGLHEKNKSLRHKIVFEMKRVVKKTGVIIIIDYQSPQPKNIWAFAARAVERLVGGEHYREFREYIENDGTGSIIRDCGLQEERRVYLKNGLLIAVKILNS